jgi:hypothetical protein
LVSHLPISFIPENIFLSHINATSKNLKEISKKSLFSHLELLSLSKNLILCSKKSARFTPDTENICILQNNIDLDELNDLCNNIGIKDVKKKIASEKNMMYYYNIKNKDTVISLIYSDFKKYKLDRKNMVHSCSFKSGIGQDYVFNYIKFVKRFTINFALVLGKEITELEKRLSGI